MLKIRSQSYKESRGRIADLLHVLEEFFATPSFKTPVVIVLLGAFNAKSTIQSGRTAEEFASAQLDLPAVDTGALLRYNVPVLRPVEVAGPAAR